MRAHPAAELFPMMPEAEIRALAEDIRQNGQRHPITLFEEQILDGRNREAACKIAGATPKYTTLDTCESPTRYVLSLNLHRRHLDSVQRAALATEVKEMLAAEAKERQRAAAHEMHAAKGHKHDPGMLRVESTTSMAEQGKAIVQAAEATGAGVSAAKIMDRARREAPEVFAAAKAGALPTVEDVKRVTSLPPEKRAEVLQKVERGEARDVKAAVAAVKLEAKHALAAELEAAPLLAPSGPYRVIVMDPPWRYGARVEDASHRGRNQYPDMSQEQLLALPVPALAEEDCALWLWTTNAFMRDAYALIDAWGFKDKTILTWVKTPGLGLGDYLRNTTEHCIVATKGRPLFLTSNQPTHIIEPKREHSRKPDQFYTLVESLNPGSKLEMFSRQPRPGWASWGAEVEKFASEAAE
jgi:N6-adenosine-specific RNA methylase IME4